MLCLGLDEQARHEHMSDEYKDRYIMQCRRNSHPGSIGRTQDHHIGSHTDWTIEGEAHQTEQRISQIRIADRLLKLS